MTKPNLFDYLLLTFLALIWSSAFFNIKIATESFGPITIAFFRVFLASLPLITICYFRKIKVEAFSKYWHWFALIGFVNLVIPFYLISYGIKEVQSNLAAILMSSTPLTSTILGHYFTKNEKFNLIKTIGVLVGFSGIVYLFSDNLLINESNFFSSLLILLGATGYVVGGVLTLKISNKKNENVTTSICIWASIILLPLALTFEDPINNSASLKSIISLIYLGVISTGMAWLIRFSILKKNGLIFQSQVSFLIPIFGIILGYIFLNEVITPKILVSVFLVIGGIYLTKKSTN